jgi:hypothetical protein
MLILLAAMTSFKKDKVSVPGSRSLSENCHFEPKARNLVLASG